MSQTMNRPRVSVVRLREDNSWCATDFIFWGFRISFHRRSHNKSFIAGIWKLGINGVQFFAGPFGLTFNWPLSIRSGK